ncbi:MAG TPA: hypothetical protein VD905_10155 [Flavobacteriales bacterium]|nr:hypothetical protein [Flavobacteriales bacterium]
MNRFLYILCTLLIGCSGKRSEKPVQQTEKSSIDTSTYALRLKIDPDRYRNSGYAFVFYEAQQLIPSIDFKGNNKLLFFDFPELKTGNNHLVCIDTASKKLCVNKTYFTDLAAVDVTRIGEQHTLGGIKPALLEKMTYREVLSFLIKAEIIQTYQHLYADVYLVKEEQYGDNYEAKFNAVHHYCTNECIDEPYKFTVVINKKTGVIAMRP